MWIILYLHVYNKSLCKLWVCEFSVMSFNARCSSSHFRLFVPPEEDDNGNVFEQQSTDDLMLDFVEIFPPELSDKLFTFLPVQDLMTCCQVSIKWRHVINNNRQWYENWFTRITTIIPELWSYIAPYLRMERCQQRKLIKKTVDGTDPLKWATFSTHVDSVAVGFKRTESPAFLLPPIASTRISRSPNQRTSPLNVPVEM